MNAFKTPIMVTKTFLPPIKEYMDEIKKIWDSNWVTNDGKINKELEGALEKYLDVNNVILFTNGHAALDIAIKSLNLNGEVITTPFTFASTTHAIVMNNLKPVFCDIKLSDFTIDENKIEKLINDKTCAIIPVHVFGNPCNVAAIDKIAKKYNLKVIYDAAHGFGVEYNRRGIGNFGDISMFSLHATKVYNSIEGGALTTKSENLKSYFKKLRNFGIVDEETVECLGINAKMNEFQAAMGLINLRYINEEIRKRKIIAEVYREELDEIPGIYYVKEDENVKYNYSYFPIIVNEEITGVSRNELYNKLKEYNVFTRKYFYPLVTDFDCYKGVYDDSDITNAKHIVDRILVLPIYAGLEKEEAVNIVEIIKSIICFKKNFAETS
ncbi:MULTISPECIES: DegT/DnrJ/EryC1/StrS family aminotransferase [unclassified Clostridium]|uniref:DegT/DnrJ/EryC1/StrS family aminotransferase n=1 Tax=unclassified Clostridium TaxID=2614128 RepID=UPI000297349D|nr:MULTISPECIES: DegT/DnrJ/EryC1/StrS family aminotransferase [unclassified Clostridium]EKQ56937.1 MAG: putative PLP-dependent enzyme possibly involved in cell wall biogenesis [Clostridium sp. Maddingley MBC34-26]